MYYCLTMNMWFMRTFLFLATYHALFVNGDTTSDHLSNDRLYQLEKLFKAQSQQISDLTQFVQQQNMEMHYLKQEVRRFADIVNTNENFHLSPNQTFRGTSPTNDVKMLPKIHHGGKDKTTDSLPFVGNQTAQVNSGSFIRQGRQDRLLLNKIEDRHTVGFYAFLSQRERMGQHKVIVFDVVRTNVGHGYNNHSGMFTAPLSGLNGFTWSLFPGPMSAGSLEILRNNDVEAFLFVDSDSANFDLTSSSMTVALLLNQGDDVFIRTKNGYNNVGTIESDDNAKSAVAGWLIH